MNWADHPPARHPRLSDRTFKELGVFIHSHFGIKMPSSKKQMVESRLRKRLTLLKLDSYDDYCTYLFSAKGKEKELNEFINQITTNKTDFFREPAHFSFLERQALPALVQMGSPGSGHYLRIWSTACSRGHEPYTIAMVVNEFSARHPGRIREVSILGTDISSRVLAESKRAVYPHEEIAPVDMPLRRKYLLKSRNRRDNLVRIVPFLRQQVTFRRMNLMDDELDIRPGLDIVFCRNVMIYFDRKTQDILLRKICQKIRSNGYLFMGHSEVLHDRSLPLKAVAPTVYMKQN